MQRLNVNIAVTDKVPGDGFHAYVGADVNGEPTGSIDFAAPFTGDEPRPFWPLATQIPGHLERPFLGEPFLDVPAETPPDHVVVTPALYFGVFALAVKSFDALGNASSGTPVEFDVPVNSGPANVSRFKHSSTVSGRPVFTYNRPPQFV